MTAVSGQGTSGAPAAVLLESGRVSILQRGHLPREKRGISRNLQVTNTSAVCACPTTIRNTPRSNPAALSLVFSQHLNSIQSFSNRDMCYVQGCKTD